MTLGLLDKTGGQAHGSKAARPARDDELAGDEALRCAECGHAITSRRARIEAAGRHEHTFVNPGGYVYRIGCFKSAPGCEVLGAPTSEWSWFEGYSWQIACCGSCGELAGWRFGSEGGSFFGLIADKLAAS